MRPLSWNAVLLAASTLLATRETQGFCPSLSPSTTSVRGCTSLGVSSLSSEIVLLSYDGTVAETTDWRIDQGIDLALSVWPRLKKLSVIAGDDDNDDDDDDFVSDSDTNMEWLRNKMRAVSDVMVSRPAVSMSCDYALLARLLIEEQQLDRGRSNGCSGKYGSKFHPRETSSSSSPLGASRPLTVGEISANWNKGGCLAETLQVKYHIDFENPLPVLQDRIAQLDKEKQYKVPEMNKAILDALEHSCGNIIVTVGHESDMEMAKKTLSFMNIPLSTVTPDNDSLRQSLDTSRENDESIKLLAVSTTHASIYRDVLRMAHFGSTVYIFESSWHALKQGISLFGDNIPRRGSGMAETIIGKGINLSLNLPKWSSSVEGDINQQNEATMNAWTNLVEEIDCAELLSARIVPSPAAVRRYR
ncbi:expressed unknown protein [Seminavis robusta]|uniref:Uncharacterized protein n=1 Tax=Seminavis robusta TaxID=568900 RepID=A0A9N8DBT9_9STRA|nr:expressed unknown protein [Seminavis robusta]|eukprot:Sro22_g015440.1 n/a (417) ;mRNA; r:122143-123463